MKLFIADDVLKDYSYGMIVLAAASKDQIEQVLRDSGLFFMDDEEDISEVMGTYVEHGEVSGEARVIAYCYGGS
jgi:hypothetical protein